MSKIKSFITITLLLSFTIFTIHLSASENKNSHFVDDDITGIINCYLEIKDVLVADDANEISLYLQHCSMALNNGAEWLSVSDNIANPYFGSSMVTCGEILERVK